MITGAETKVFRKKYGKEGNKTISARKTTRLREICRLCDSQIEFGTDKIRLRLRQRKGKAHKIRLLLMPTALSFTCQTLGRPGEFKNTLAR